MIAAMAAGLAIGAVHTAPACGRLASSARDVRQYWRDFGRAKELSPMERLVFSLILAKGRNSEHVAAR